MDPDNFHQVNGTYGDVEYAESWGERISESKEEHNRLLESKLRDVIRLLEANGYGIIRLMQHNPSA